MNIISAFVVIGSGLLLSACAHSPSDASSNANAVQWKEVTRIEGGNFVTYRVPVTQKVQDDVNLHSFDPNGKAPQAPATAASSASAKASSNAEPTSASRPGSAATLDDLVFVPPVGQRYAAAQNPAAANAGTSTTPASISQDALIALGHAEIAVRGAQSRFEAAQNALNRARDAARNGDSAAAMKFAKTAMSLAQSGE